MSENASKNMVLLDSNILIHLLRKDESVRKHIKEVGWQNCCISEITKVELLYGVACSAHQEKNRKLVEELLDHLTIIPFSTCIEVFCLQKSMLRKEGKMIEDNDLYIASTALALDIPLATENTKHMNRIAGLKVQNWVERS